MLHMVDPKNEPKKLNFSRDYFSKTLEKCVDFFNVYYIKVEISLVIMKHMNVR